MIGVVEVLVVALGCALIGFLAGGLRASWRVAWLRSRVRGLKARNAELLDLLSEGEEPGWFVSNEACRWVEDAALHYFDFPDTVWPEGLTPEAGWWAWHAARTQDEAFGESS